MSISTRILILLLTAVFLSPHTAEAGVFSNSIFNNAGVVSTTSPRALTIFQKNLGAPNPVRWARQLPGTINPEKFLSSSDWQSTRADILQTYGNNANVNQYLEYQEYLFRRAIRTNNIASSRSLDVKGNLAESLMDDFYTKDGWEILDGKRGRNGIDGLYVKRTKNGVIKDVIVADAKSGTSPLKKTKHGKQLSPEWIDYNLGELLAEAEQEYLRKPLPETAHRIANIKQIMKIPVKRARVFQMMVLEQKGNKIVYRFQNLDVNKNPIEKPMFVNMNAPNSGKALEMYNKIFSDLEKHISIYNPKGAKWLVNRIQKAFQKGTIKSDSDLYRFIKREIPDPKLAAAVAQELGMKPPRGSLAGVIGEKIRNNSGRVLSTTSIVGFIIARDAMKNGISLETFKSAGFAFGMGLTVDYMINKGVRWVSRKMAERILVQSAAEDISSSSVETLTERLIPTVGKRVGIGLQTAFFLWEICQPIYDYNKGNITQSNMFIKVTSRAMIFWFILDAAEAGGAIGGLISGGNPVGAIIGGVIGVVFGGVVGGFFDGGIDNYIANEYQKNLLYEARHLANWETENNRMRLEKTIRDLEEKSKRLHDEAWHGLLPTTN